MSTSFFHETQNEVSELEIARIARSYKLEVVLGTNHGMPDMSLSIMSYLNARQEDVNIS